MLAEIELTFSCQSSVAGCFNLFQLQLEIKEKKRKR